MRALVWFFIMSLSVAVQSTLIPALSIGGIRPDFVLVVVVSAALAEGSETGVLCGVLGGLLQDLLSAGPFGINTIAKMLIGWGVGFYERKVNKGNLLLPLLAVTAGTIGATAVSAGFLLAYGMGAGIPALTMRMLPTVAYHILLAAPIHAVVGWWKRRQATLR